MYLCVVGVVFSKCGGWYLFLLFIYNMLHYKVILHVPVILLLYYALLYYKISSEDITVIVSG